ncbi:MAG: hypothetical protein K0S74_348 [Chlamydiales bacterium]|jgi:hypothetical protein|nr:hypothetical protein [Chlamydiales bacterium]
MPTEYTSLLTNQHSAEDYLVTVKTNKALEGLKRAEKSTPYLIGVSALLSLSCITLATVAFSKRCSVSYDSPQDTNNLYVCQVIETISDVALGLLGTSVGAVLYKKFLYR